MDLNTYQELSAATAVYPDDPEYLTMALMGECGEIANVRKKSLRWPQGDWKEKFIDETGDVLWYLSAIAREDGRFTLQEIHDRSMEAFSTLINGKSLRSVIRNLVLAAVELDFVTARDGYGAGSALFHYTYPIMEKMIRIWNYYNISLDEVMEYNLAKLKARQAAGELKVHE